MILALAEHPEHGQAVLLAGLQGRRGDPAAARVVHVDHQPGDGQRDVPGIDIGVALQVDRGVSTTDQNTVCQLDGVAVLTVGLASSCGATSSAPSWSSRPSRASSAAGDQT